jgi:phosphoribosylcarboxyaminoimidazole (NCAIR) mutase
LGFTRVDSTVSETKQKFRKAKIFLRNLGLSADELGMVDSKTSLHVIDMAVSEQIMKGIDIKGQIH